MALRSKPGRLLPSVLVSLLVSLLLFACYSTKETASQAPIPTRTDAETPKPDRSDQRAQKPVVPPADTKKAPDASPSAMDRLDRGAHPIPESHRKGGVAAPLTRAGSKDTVTVKKIPGYKTPAEYFMVPSKNYPEAVAVVTLPKDYSKRPDKHYPLVIAFGGAGECARPPSDGSLAWMHYYKTDEAVDALSDNTLEEDDFRGLVMPAHLREFNERLEKNPYEGIILVCPSSPPLSHVGGVEFPWYEAYIMDDLIPALKKRYRVAQDRLGVDGVSMGGTRSLYFGFKYPDVFSSIGAVQGAVGGHIDEYKDLIDRNREKLKNRSLQLVTSDRDYLAPSVRKMHRLLLAEKIPHLYYMLTGPHDYIFNQGPGSVALLVFHNEALNGKPVGPVK